MRKKIDENRDLKKRWGKYWKGYSGVTKIGEWSQKASLSKALFLIFEEKIKKGVKIVDIGCGEGRTLKALRSFGFKKGIGIDNTKESLEVCKKKGLVVGKDVFLKEAGETGFKKGEFDLVFSEGLLEHFTDPTSIISEMGRISKRYVLLIQPNHYSLYGFLISFLGNLLRNNIKEYSFPKEYFVNKFEERGFLLKKEEKTLLNEFFILLFEKN